MNFRNTVTETGIPRATIMLWIRRGKIKPLKIPNSATAAGFVYDFPPKLLPKMKRMHKGPGWIKGRKRKVSK